MALNSNEFTDKLNDILRESKDVAIEASNPQVCDSLKNIHPLNTTTITFFHASFLLIASATCLIILFHLSYLAERLSRFTSQSPCSKTKMGYLVELSINLEPIPKMCSES